MTDMSILGSKGGSKPHAPVESPDSLINVSYANILDGISEGPIVGLVNGAQSIYLDKTPLANSDGSLNFSGVTWEQRTGEHDQDHIAGFPAVESQTSVGVELEASQSWVQSFSNLELSAVRIQLAVGALVRTESDGDMVGYTVNYEIDLSTDDGDYKTVLKAAFSGKTTTGYQRSHRIEFPKATSGWRIRVRRTTPDSTDSRIQATTSIGTYTEVIDAKLQYPYTALCGLKMDASQFSAVPERAYRIRGRIIQVPSNYDAATRTYTGNWDGTFKLAWTDCPPWIWRDIVLNDRYGLGRFIDAGQVDKWGLYEIAQYCDHQVSNGKGGQEPRFTCNVYLQSRADALNVLQDLASVFRGMSYYAGSEVACAADMPGDPVYTYTNANVIDGKFNRPGSSGSTRFSVAKVAWSDRENFGNQRVEYVQDQTAIGRYGIRETEITAFGCVSQGQAQRAGKYILLTNRLETGTINFSVGLDGTICRPGDIIRVADENFAGLPIGGRLKAATTTTVTLDNDVAASAGDTLVVILPKGVAETRIIRSIVGRLVTVTQSFSKVPVKESIYTIETAELVAETYRVLTVNENFGDDKLQYDIVAVERNASKFEAIDNGAQIVTPPTSVLPGAVQTPPSNIELSTFDTVSQGVNVATMRITWDAPRGAQHYNVWWKRDDGDWIYAGVTYTAAMEVKGIYSGVYIARVAAVGVAGSSSIWAFSKPTQLYGKTGEPPALASFSAATELFGIRLNWAFPGGAADTFYTEIQESLAGNGENPVQLSMVAYPARTYLKSGMAAGVTRFFRARLADRTGNTGPWTAWTFGQSGSDAGPVLELLGGRITESELGQDVLELIQKIPGLQEQIDSLDGLKDYNPNEAYTKDKMVFVDGRIYQAKQAVPANSSGANGPPNATYWIDVGQSVVSANGLAQQVATNTADITELDGVVTAQATSLEVLRASYRDDGGAGAMADALKGWESTTAIATQRKVQASENRATAERMTTFDAKVAANEANLTELERVVATNESASATKLSQLGVTVGQNSVAIQETSSVVADLSGDLSLMWSMKFQANANGQLVFAGIGAGIENGPGGLQSTLLFTANQIAFANPSSAGALDYPFIIKNGQNFLGSTFIEDGTITNAKIGSYISSTNYVAGQQGWILNKSGTFEINGNVPGQGRLTITNQRVRIYHANGNLAIDLGVSV